MEKEIDFTYYSMRSAIVKSYCNGDMDNNFNQLEISIQQLDKLYNIEDFAGLDPWQTKEKKIKLLNKIQVEVDKRTGVFNGFTS